MFGAPLWLIGLVSLAIPLALHLWSRRPRDVIRVGSLRHLGDVAAARTWSTRLSEPLLLALRLGLLAAIVFALAGPRLSAPRLGGAPSRLVLVDPALLGDSAALAEPLLDSLVRQHAKVRLIAPGLPARRLWDPRTSSYSAAPHPLPADELTLWDALVEADRVVAAGGTLHVIARPLVGRLGGQRPRISARVKWHSPPAPEPRIWTAARWLTPADSIRTITGKGDAQAVRYAVANQPPAACARCSPLPLRRIAIDAGEDAALSLRITAAAEAVAAELGQPIQFVPAADSADLLITIGALADSLFRPAMALARLSRSTAMSSLVADTLLARWPWPPLARDPGDTREVSLRQAAPDSGPRRPEPADSRRGRRFLLVLAAGLFLLERWFATRPQAGSG